MTQFFGHYVFRTWSMYKENIRRESIESSKNNLSIRTSTINSKLSHSTYVWTERYHLNCPQILNQCSRVIFIFEMVVVFCTKDWWAHFISLFHLNYQLRSMLVKSVNFSQLLPMKNAQYHDILTKKFVNRIHSLNIYILNLNLCE